MLIKNLKYDGYDTGSYGESRADGITLHFFSEDTSLQYYTIFNVNRTKQRGPSKGKEVLDYQEICLLPFLVSKVRIASTL